MGINPSKDSIVESTRVDDIGPLETRQIYQYGLGGMPNGDVIFVFVYATMVFSVNLSRRTTLEYILSFNDSNSFVMNSRWNLFHRRNVNC